MTKDNIALCSISKYILNIYMFVYLAGFMKTAPAASSRPHTLNQLSLRTDSATARLTGSTTLLQHPPLP